MAFKFPFTNYHELNLTWVLDQLKKLFEESAENVTTIENYNGRLTAVETELPLVADTAQGAAQSAAAAASLAQQAKSTADTAQENAIQAQGLAGQARQEAQAAQSAADAATQAAQQAQATAQNFDGRITHAENNASEALEASRSFENRVQAAITTANNAAQTATNAQGIATRADQNAGTALDKIGDLSQLDTTAKRNLVAAINEVFTTGGNVQSVNGKTGAVVLNAEDIGYNNTTVKNALDGKQDAPLAAGTAGQVLGLDSSLRPVWVSQSGGGSEATVIESGRKVEFDTDLQEEIGIIINCPFISVPNNSIFLEIYHENLATTFFSGTDLKNDGTTEEGAATVWTSDFINVSDYETVYLRLLYGWTSSYRTRICFYNDNKEFTRLYYSNASSGRNNLFTINVTGVSYIRFTCRANATPNEDPAKVYVLTPDITRYAIDTSNLYGGYINCNNGTVVNTYNASGESIAPEIVNTFTPITEISEKQNVIYATRDGFYYTLETNNEITYKETMQKYVDDKIAELQALVLENNG